MDQDRRWLPTPIRGWPRADRVDASRTRKPISISAKRDVAAVPFDKLVKLYRMTGLRFGGVKDGGDDNAR